MYFYHFFAFAASHTPFYFYAHVSLASKITLNQTDFCFFSGSHVPLFFFEQIKCSNIHFLLEPDWMDHVSLFVCKHLRFFWHSQLCIRMLLIFTGPTSFFNPKGKVAPNKSKPAQLLLLGELPHKVTPRVCLSMVEQPSYLAFRCSRNFLLAFAPQRTFFAFIIFTRVPFLEGYLIVKYQTLNGCLVD